MHHANHAFGVLLVGLGWVGLVASLPQPSSAEPPVLAIRTDAGRGGVGFRISNPTPFASGPAELIFTIWRAGQIVASERSMLVGLEPFAERAFAPADWAAHVPGTGRACVRVRNSNATSERCAELVLPGTLPDLSIGTPRVHGSVIAVELRNEGEAESGAFELRITTRAAGRVIGTARPTAATLAPRSLREERFSLELWGGGLPEVLHAISGECCTTEIELDPADRIKEADEDNNERALDHPLPSS